MNTEVELRSNSASMQLCGGLDRGNTNGIVKTTRNKIVQAQQQREEIIQASSSGSKLSWADEVETETAQIAKPSVWDNSDIGKI